MATVHRTARIKLRLTRAQRRRCFALLVAAGDVWAMVLDCNRALRSWRCRPIVNFFALCRELTGMQFGELPRHCAEDVLKRYSAAWLEAARRRSNGEEAGFPRRKRRLITVRFRKGTFAIEGRQMRLATAARCAPLRVRLARDIPYPAEAIRSLTLLAEAGELFLDVTAQLPVAHQDGDRERVAGVDLGIIHPYALVSADEGMLVSGRALRAEERLHLEDTKQRARKTAARAPSRGQKGSRRWRKIRARQRKQEARHQRRIRQAHHEAAKQVIEHCADRGVGALVVGDPKGITSKEAGRKQNLRLRQWRRTHLLRALIDKAQAAGITVRLVDERGTSSTCPECATRVPKPNGRVFACRSCGLVGHRDLVGARNIAARGGGTTSTTVLVTHRRAGSPPARRDRRRHLYDVRRSCPGSGPPHTGESLARTTSEDLVKCGTSPYLRQGALALACGAAHLRTRV